MDGKQMEEERNAQQKRKEAKVAAIAESVACEKHQCTRRCPETQIGKKARKQWVIVVNDEELSPFSSYQK